MERYIARQPIFDTNLSVCAYELLYRSGARATQADFEDGDKATQSLLSNAITVFGLPSLTNSRPAFVNFTENLILNDFVFCAKPGEIVVELLEDIEVTPPLVEKMTQLHEMGYVLALDDFVGGNQYDEVLPLVDIIKVDFMLADEAAQKKIADRFRGSGIRLLAEKVETQEDVDRARKMGYSMFQGYFFEKPAVMQSNAKALAITSYVNMMHQVTRREIDIIKCANVIHADAALTYELFRKVNTMRYYRGNSIKSIRIALSILGVDEIRRWIILLLARERNVTCSDEIVRVAYLRAVFLEQLMEHSRWRHRSSEGYLTGMFSLLDKVMGQNLEEMLDEVVVSQDIRDALLGRNRNIFSEFLAFVLAYERNDSKLPALPLDIPMVQVANLYMECIKATDDAFKQNI